MEFNLSIGFGNKKKGFEPTIPQPATTQVITTGLSTSALYSSVTNALAKYFKDPRSAVIFCYHNIPEFTAPINYLIKTVVNIPIVHEKKSGKDWKVVENSPVLSMLRNPNQFQTETEFLTYFLLNTLLSGEIFLNKFIPVGFSKMSKMFVLPSGEMQIDWNNDAQQDYRLKSILRYRYNWSELQPESVIWRKEIVSLTNPTECGVSRLYPLVNTGHGLQAIAESTIKTIEDRGALGIISPQNAESIFTEDDPAKIQAKLSEKYGITGDKSTTIVTTKAVTYTPMSFNVGELQLNETRLSLFRSVCMVLTTPSQLFGDTANSTYNNMMIAQKVSYENSAIPLANWMLETLEQAFEFSDNERLRLDLSEIEALKADRQIQANIANSVYNSGLATSDEAREMIGLEPDGRSYKIPENKTIANGQK